jgi:hypothetical protein
MRREVLEIIYRNGNMRLDALMVVNIMFFWDATTCRLVHMCQGLNKYAASVFIVEDSSALKVGIIYQNALHHVHKIVIMVQKWQLRLILIVT